MVMNSPRAHSVTSLVVMRNEMTSAVGTSIYSYIEGCRRTSLQTFSLTDVRLSVGAWKFVYDICLPILLAETQPVILLSSQIASPVQPVMISWFCSLLIDI